MSRHSKLQKHIISLYRQLIRVARSKPGAVDYIRYEFHKNATIPKGEVMKIEQLLRRGERQLESLKKSSTTGVGLFQSDDNDPAKKNWWQLNDGTGDSAALNMNRNAYRARWWAIYMLINSILNI